MIELILYLYEQDQIYMSNNLQTNYYIVQATLKPKLSLSTYVKYISLFGQITDLVSYKLLSLPPKLHGDSSHSSECFKYSRRQLQQDSNRNPGLH